MRPAAHLLSFASPKESRQRKGDPTGRVPSLRCGQPAMLGHGAALRNSLRACSAPLEQPQRARARSAAILRWPHPPHALRFSARPEGTRGQNGPSLRSAPEQPQAARSKTGALRRPRGRPSQRTPWPGLYRPVALSPLAKQEGGRRRRRLRGAFPIPTPCSGLHRALALSPLAKQEGGRRRRRLRGVFIRAWAARPAATG